MKCDSGKLKMVVVHQSPLLSAALSVEEGNLLISEFLEDKINSNQTEVYPKGSYGCGGCYSVENLRYHYSWDWLMPVCQKISTLKDYPMPILNGISSAVPYVNAMTKMIKGAVKFDLNKTYLGVIEFIKWYNDNAVSVGSR